VKGCRRSARPGVSQPISRQVVAVVGADALRKRGPGVGERVEDLAVEDLLGS
jgi:hypothetical protein